MRRGEEVAYDYEGHRFIIIEQKELAFSTPERIKRGLLGVIIVIFTLCLGLFSKSVRNLFIQRTKKIIRFGISDSFAAEWTNPTGSVSNNNSSLQKPVPHQVEPILDVDVSLYTDLKKYLKQAIKTETDTIDTTLYVTDQTGTTHPETLIKILGKGGSKRVFQTSKGRALILPNMDADPTSQIAERWKRMVLEELAMSKALQKYGLLTLELKQVSVTLEKSSESVIPAYVTDTFESLENSKGWFIIDTKESSASTWKQGEDFLFQSDAERLHDNNWDSVFDSLLTEITKICLYNLPAKLVPDTLNIAVVKKRSDSNVCQHEIHYFGFDFSSKYEPVDIPDAENRAASPLNTAQAEKLLNCIINYVFLYEFDYDCAHEKHRPDLINLKNRLIQKYMPILVKKHIHLIVKNISTSLQKNISTSSQKSFLTHYKKDIQLIAEKLNA